MIVCVSSGSQDVIFRGCSRNTFGSERGRCRHRAWVSYVGLVKLSPDYRHAWPRCKIIPLSSILSILTAVNSNLKSHPPDFHPVCNIIPE